MCLTVAVGRVVAEHQLGMRSVGPDGPKRVAEVGTLVQILRTRPKNTPVLHD